MTGELFRPSATGREYGTASGPAKWGFAAEWQGGSQSAAKLALPGPAHLTELTTAEIADGIGRSRQMLERPVGAFDKGGRRNLDKVPEHEAALDEAFHLVSQYPLVSPVSREGEDEGRSRG